MKCAQSIYTNILFLILLIGKITSKIPKQFCMKNPKTLAACRNMRLWTEEKKNFVPLLSKVNDIQDVQSESNATVVRTVISDFRPYISVNNKMEANGYLHEIFRIMQEEVGFKYFINIIHNYTYIEKISFRTKYIYMDYDNGLQAINNGSADILLSAGIANSKHLNIYYASPYTTNWYHVYFKSWEKHPSSLYYFQTLNPSTWIITIITATILCICLWATIKVHNTVRNKEPHISFASCLIFVCSGFLNQGYELKLRSLSCKIQMLIALFLGYLISSALNALLIAKITVVYEHYPIKSLEEIANHRDEYSLCIRSESFVINNFINVSTGEFYDKWKGIVNGPGCLDMNNRLNAKELLCKDKVFILENRIIVNDLLKHNDMKCKISHLPQRYFIKGNSLIINKYLLLIQQKLQTAYMKLAETGVNNRNKKKWLKMNYEISDASTTVSISGGHVRTIFIIYGCMIVFSIVILGIEILTYKYYDQKKKPSLKRQRKPNNLYTFVN